MLRVLRWSAVLSGVVFTVACSSDGDGDDNPGSASSARRCDQFVAELKSCGVATEESGTSGCVDELVSDCSLDCVKAASCEDEAIFFCTPDTPPDLGTCLASCPALEFDCGDGSGTYLGTYVCDGIADCENGVDEADCNITCDDGVSIPKAFQCDGVSDCSAGDDEVGCLFLECSAYADPPIPEDAHAGCEPFKAALEACGLVSEGTIFCSPAITPCLADCYAAASCEELTDAGCTGAASEALAACAAECPQSYSCDGTSGFSPELVCDSVTLCVDGTDEPTSCPTYTCGDGAVIPLQYQCDGAFVDCADGSDEEGCATLVCPE
jgi:hypothetical protein